MNHEVFNACALTGTIDTTGKSIPVVVASEEIAKRGGIHEKLQLKLVLRA